MSKRIACLSTLVPPDSDKSYSEQVFEIFDAARRYNKEHDIVGVFIVYQDTLLTIFEGAGNELAQVIYRSNRDSRIRQFSVIVNQDVAETKFTRWNLKLIHDNCEAHRDYLGKVHRLLEQKLKLGSPTDRLRYEKMMSLQCDTTPAVIDESSTPVFANSLLSMKSWPRPTALRMDAGLMKICPLLIHKTVAYDRLKGLKLFSQIDELDRRLLQLHNVNALQVTPQTQPAAPRPIQSASRSALKSQHSFSQALRQFISQRRNKGGSKS